MGWGWYLQNDMQLFILSMGLLLIYHFKPIVSKGLIWVLTILSLIFTFHYTYVNDITVTTHLADFAKWDTYMTDVYIKPWARCPPYIIGLYLGISYHEYLT